VGQLEAMRDGAAIASKRLWGQSRSASVALAGQRSHSTANSCRR